MISILVLVALLFAGCTQQTVEQPLQEHPQTAANSNVQTNEPANSNPNAGITTPMQFSLSSPAFTNNGVIPVKYTCKGGDVIPPLAIAGAPSNTQSFALIMDDPDAVQVVGFTYVHWVVFDIPPMATEMPEGRQIGIIGSAGSGEKRYEGPCPPPGETHSYSFRLYALDVEVSLQEGATKEQLETAMQGHILAQAELKGKYGS